MPMPFAESCRITSDVKLEGYDRSKGEGGWGHVVCHTYYDGRAVTTFQRESGEYEELIRLWKGVGGEAIPFVQEQKKWEAQFTLMPGEEKTVFADDQGGLISGLCCLTEAFQRENLRNLWIRAIWDGHDAPDVDTPFGCFFANELGYHPTAYLLAGMDAQGGYYQRYPMPYATGARIMIVNKGEVPVRFAFLSIRYTREFNGLYRKEPFGYFRSSHYYGRRHTEGADSIIARVKGSGQIVGSVITGYGRTPEEIASCEGDVRLHIDGSLTPQIESDGSESYSCYGWGFISPPERNPASGYDGQSSAHVNWSMFRSLMGDWYPFADSFRFGIESGGNNDCYMEHSGAVFYYGRDESRLRKVLEIKMGDRASEEAAGYAVLDNAPVQLLSTSFEGDDDHVVVSLQGRYIQKGSTFRLYLPENTGAVLVRRISDQSQGRQCARVYVDGEPVPGPLWYFADHNPIKRWLEDDFWIPGICLAGKRDVSVTMEPQSVNGICTWNEFGYQVFCEICPGEKV